MATSQVHALIGKRAQEPSAAPLPAIKSLLFHLSETEMQNAHMRFSVYDTSLYTPTSKRLIISHCWGTTVVSSNAPRLFRSPRGLHLIKFHSQKYLRYQLNLLCQNRVKIVRYTNSFPSNPGIGLLCHIPDKHLHLMHIH